MTGDDITRLAAQYGTPLFVYDARAIAVAHRQLRAAIPAEVALLYSIKANPNPVVCGILCACGLDAEIASAGELDVALAAGFAPEHMGAAGPGKTRRELDRYVAAGLGVIHVESTRELVELDRAAAEQHVRQRVALRVNPAKTETGARVKMGGRPSQFGVDEEAMDDAIALAERLAQVALVGVHVYAGTQILAAAQVVANTEHAAAIAQRVAERLDRPLEVVNFGGGLGVPFSPDEVPLDLDALGAGLLEACARLRRHPLLAPARLEMEIGRWLVARAGRFVCRVEDVKTSRGRKYVVLDGGINADMAVSPLFRFNRKPPILKLLGREAHAGGEPVDVVGPLCTSLDSLAIQIALGEPRPGDLVIFEHAGAYGLTMSPVLFLSRGVPPEVVVHENGRRSVIRREAVHTLSSE